MNETTNAPAPGEAAEGTTKNFPLGDVLSVTTGRLLANEGIGAVYEILNFMTGDNLFTHQLPRAGRLCAPVLLEQHPILASVDIEAFDARIEKAADKTAFCELWLL